VTFSISYNKIDWHDLNTTKFEFETCEPGYTAESYKSPCFMCPPGYYKPTNGLYNCIPCKKGYYNSFAGATDCQACPANTTTVIEGASSFKDCLCDVGFYLNHDTTQHSDAHKKCI